MRTIQEILLIKIWPLVARLSSVAPGAISISLLAVGLALALIVINMAYDRMIYMKSRAHHRQTSGADAARLQRLTQRSGDGYDSFEPLSTIGR